MASNEETYIIFDGPPPEGGGFVEVENAAGESINVGRWESAARIGR